MLGFNLNIAYIVFPYWVTELIISLSENIPIFGSENAEETRFWSETWLPELHKELKDVPITIFDSFNLACAFIGYFMKVILAMLMQEAAIPFDLFWNETG